jgi:integrase
MHARICKWHESLADTPAGADNTLTVLQSLLNHGKRLNKLKLNAVSGIKDHYRAGQRADVVWTQEELDLFIRVACRLNMADVADAVCVAWETGFRLQDLLTVRLRHIKPHRIIKQASKVSRGRRRYAAIPRTQALDVLLERLLAQPRAEGVDHILVTSKGKPWREHQLDIAFRAVRDACAIVHVDAKTGALRPKHLHDIRGTFATRLVTQTDLTDTEIAQIMAWAPSSVAQIRAFYVDHGAFAEALGRRLAA